MSHSCPACGVPVDALRARHISVVMSGARGPRVLRYCSAECRRRGPAPAQQAAPPTATVKRPARGRAAGVLVGVGAAVAATLAIGGQGSLDHAATAALPPRPAPVAAPPAPERPMYGPEKPPFELLVERDAWVHPLAGPLRRLPLRPTRRFGAVRDHDSPESCREGHCGVDIGDTRGEPVLAVHDGVVDRVVRDENANGGRYVRLVHKNGAVITQYFHLDDIRADLVPGKPIHVGEPLGTLGVSGIKHAGPHLHFTVATRARPDAPEVYIDPEPLLSLWPLAKPADPHGEPVSRR